MADVANCGLLQVCAGLVWSKESPDLAASIDSNAKQIHEIRD